MAANKRISKQERYYFHNNLAILLKAVEGQRTTVDFRNEACITGFVDQVDGYMNIVMKECTFVDPRGDSFNYDIFFVHARNIRYVHIPPQIRIIPAIEEQLRKLRARPTEVQSTNRTWKVKRAQQKQREDLLAAQEILQNDGVPKESGQN
ncbi:U7 snRNA-associated Sm-like protein LSm10 [Neodiprion fabricii]|uniref:U7 snRNA-associated Sm-like protein LSm10 n=1 Tax=Neodiprion fabricii TaxID=2872261 RepID=UPI001ED8F1B3|nr:U7 snRNA-associated Sm-like protein LSm10 [Neodiprion fabricii]